MLLALQLKEARNSYEHYITFAAGILIFGYTMIRMEVIVETLKELTNLVAIDGLYLKILIKMIGITYLSEFAADLCRDSGYSSLAGQIQIFGKISILSVSMPVIQALLEALESFL